MKFPEFETVYMSNEFSLELDEGQTEEFARAKCKAYAAILTQNGYSCDLCAHTMYVNGVYFINTNSWYELSIYMKGFIEGIILIRK